MLLWRARLNAAKKAGVFDAEARVDSAHWASCAVGEKLKLDGDEIYKNGDIEEISPRLFALGMKFNRHVANGYINLAISVYNKIRKYNVKAGK